MGRGENGEQGACVIYGTPLENEEDISRRRAAALDKGAVRRQAVWQQEARDTEGRRRFHGAFTGGFSAGYYNTVGSKEGWEPKSFKSSRSSRADKQQHTAYDYMDEEERTEMDEKQLGTANEFDTFGFTAAEYARRQATQETQSRPAIIPGPIPDEIIVPATESIGMKLLMKMGWRHGRAIGPKHIAASSESKREGRKAMMALSNKRSTDGVDLAPADVQESEPMEARNEVDLLSSTPAFVMSPKDNLYGLGFDPYKSAPEFREMKRARLENNKKDQVLSKAVTASKPSLFRPNAGTMSKGFGIGALEELGEEDEDVYASGPRPDTLLLEDEDLDQQDKGDPDVSTRLLTYDRDVLPGFKPASVSASRAEWFDPPVVPPDYVAVHKFTVSLDLSRTQSEIAPPEVPPPLDKTLVKLVEGLATLVARSGLQLEALSKERNKENPQFQFLFGGVGSDYYLRKLWEERAKRGVQPQSKREVPKLDANERGKLLGETPLQKSVAPSIPAEDRARLQATLQKTFMKPATDANNSSRQPFEEDPAKQARFEQFMRDKYRGGLRKMDLGAQQMTEVQRAQELLEFETVAHAVQGRIPQERSSVEAKYLPSSSSSSSVLQKLAVNRFTSGGHEHAGSFVKSSEEKQKPSEKQETETTPSHYPKRTQQPWRPLPLLCKRFDLLDPYAGKPAPVKPKSRIESLTLATTSESFLGSKLNEALNQGNTEHESLNDNLPIQVDEKQEAIEQIQEKPVDLYKAIFSDDSDDDTDLQVAPQSVPLVKQVDAANAALNRLVADDFLESLGKELGLEVPPPPLPAVREARVIDDTPKDEVEFNKTFKDDEKPTTVREARVNDDIARGQSESTRTFDHDQKKNQARNLSTGVVHDKSNMLNEKTDEPKDHTSRLDRPKLKEDRALDSKHKSHRSHEKSEKRKEKDKKRKHRQEESSEDRRKRKRREKKERHERHKSRKKHRSPSSSSTSSM